MSCTNRLHIDHKPINIQLYYFIKSMVVPVDVV